MRDGHSSGIRMVALTTAATLLLSPLAAMIGGPVHAATTIQGAAASDVAPADPGWPRTYAAPSGARVQIFQPQIASWDGQAHLVAYAAVAYYATGIPQPVLGTMKVESDTRVSLEQRLVSFAAFRITEASFGSLGRDKTREIVVDIGRAIPAGERVIALDRVLAGLDTSRIQPKSVEGVKADPPTIYFSSQPALLVNFDGSPIWSPIKGVDLAYAVNTNWDVFQHGPSKTLFLRNDRVWLTASTLKGPWVPVVTLPASFDKLPADENWKEVKASLPARRIAANEMPDVFVSTAPAELLLLRGAPSYLQVSSDSQLLWVSNTESDVFRLGKTGPVYYLVSGRWFSAPGFNGPWTFATPTLPSAFARIPVEHPRSRVLASVPGTSQAAEAVLLAQLPQTAKVSKRNLQAPEVIYQGDPRFQPIEKTLVQHAVNTDRDVIKVGDLYYMCFQGVWFVSTTPHGQWEVASRVPSAIYEIPASSPVHHVTYVTILDDDPDWVTFATAAGYNGVMVAWGCAVWGTGWYYPPYVGYVGSSPVYYPFSPTYGYSAWYNPWAGAYERGAVAYGPYGGAGAAARYNPSTGTYSRGAVAWGPNGANGAAQAYNPRTGTYAQTRQGAGVYGSWGSSYVQRGDNWVQTARATNKVTGNTTRVTRTDDGGMVSRVGPGGGSFVAAGEEGVYAGHDGNVYRRADGGGWQKYENGGWGATQKPETAGAARERAEAGAAPGQLDRATVGQLDRDRSARIEGSQRVREHGAFQGGAPSPGSYRPSGARAGGRRR